MGYAYDYGYDYPVNSGMSDSVFAVVMSIYLIVIMLALILFIVEYVFRGIGLYTIGKRMGKSSPWLAFIPFARTYFHGELAGTIALKTKKVKSPGVWNLVLPIIWGIVVSIFYFIFFFILGFGVFSSVSYSHGYGYNPVIGGGAVMVLVVLILLLVVLLLIYQAVYSVLTALINFQIYGRFTTRNMAIAHSVLSIILPLYESFCLFALRNRDFNPGMEPRLTPPPVRPIYPGNPVPPVPPTAPEGEKPVPPVPPAAPEGEKPVPPVPPAVPEQEEKSE